MRRHRRGTCSPSACWDRLLHGGRPRRQAISLDFIFTAAPTGVGPELLGTAIIVAVATLIAMPIGVLIALFLTEFAGNRAAAPIRLTLDLMNGLPSIIIGLFIFGLLVDHHKQSGFAGSIALAIIEVPLIARGSQEVLLLVPSSMREASDALGVDRWRSVLTHRSSRARSAGSSPRRCSRSPAPPARRRP